VLVAAVLGSRGATQEQLLNVLLTPQVYERERHNPLNFLAQAVKEMTKFMSKVSEFNEGNLLFHESQVKISPEYAVLIRDAINCEIKEVKDSGSFVESGNKWIAEKTKGLITNFLTRSMVEKINFGLLNAVYFKGDWLEPFEKSETREALFRSATGGMQKCQMMFQRFSDLRMLKHRNYDAICLDYKSDSKLAAILILPKEEGGMPATDEKEAEETSEYFPSLFASMQPASAAQSASLPGKAPPKVDLTKISLHDICRVFSGSLSRSELKGLQTVHTGVVKVKLPRIKLSSPPKHLDLVPPMKRMGVVDIFSESKADLSGMVIKRMPPVPVWADQLIQMAVLESNETGTIAAAVTFMGGREMASAPRPPPKIEEFYADRPHLYTVMVIETCVPLFLAVVDNVA
jgi:serpin B